MNTINNTGNRCFPETKTPEKKETILTKQMKSQFSFFGPASMIYALFYAFCLYKNASGITYPFFAAGTLCYFFLSMKKLGVPYKKDSLFYVISILLLGISNCRTTSPQLLFMNKTGIFLLSFVLFLHTVYYDAGWDFPKYIGAIVQTTAGLITCLFSPLMDLTSFFDAQKQRKSDKNSPIGFILIGIAISIPILTVIVVLLGSADVVFRNMIDRILFSWDFSFLSFFRICLLIAVVFLASYALLSALCMKKVKEEVTDHKIWEPLIAITVTGMLAMVYLVFSLIQIIYLFIGNMRLPDGYTYSSYARQGFFQLLIVCVLNLLLVIFCLSFFKDHTGLKIILTVISGCTFIMIISSALRMFMYIARYNLTFLRVFVLWSLAVIFLLMAGVTVSIYFRRFPLFFYCVAVTTVFYIGLSFARPDYLIASYNLNPAHMEYLDEYDLYDAEGYLSQLSTDAAPILLSREKNPYLGTEDVAVPRVNDDLKSRRFYYYYMNILHRTEEMNLRNFNFSIYMAGKSAGL